MSVRVVKLLFILTKISHKTLDVSKEEYDRWDDPLYTIKKNIKFLAIIKNINTTDQTRKKQHKKKYQKKKNT